MFEYVVKAVAILAILLICHFVGELYKVYERTPESRGTDRGNIALGMFAEIAWVIYLVVLVITK
jgi:hypothetical protein